MLCARMEVEGLDLLPNEASKNLSPGILLGPSWWWDGGRADRQVFNLSFVPPGERACLCPCPLRHSILQRACFSLGAARQAHGLAFIFLPGNFGSVSCCHPLGIPCGWWHSPWPPRWAGSPEPPGGRRAAEHTCPGSPARLNVTRAQQHGEPGQDGEPSQDREPSQDGEPGQDGLCLFPFPTGSRITVSSALLWYPS